MSVVVLVMYCNYHDVWGQGAPLRAVRESLRKQGVPFLSSLRVIPTFSRLCKIVLQTLSIYSLYILNDFPKQSVCSCRSQCVLSVCLSTVSGPSVYCLNIVSIMRRNYSFVPVVIMFLADRILNLVSTLHTSVRLQ